MKTLIALLAIAAGKYGEGQVAIDEGAKFEVSDDMADKMVTTGDARLDDAAPPEGSKQAKSGKKAKVRLLMDSALGNANDVVEVDAGEVKALERDGVADSDKAAVTYAQTLPQNKA